MNFSNFYLYFFQFLQFLFFAGKVHTNRNACAVFKGGDEKGNRFHNVKFLSCIKNKEMMNTGIRSVHSVHVGRKVVLHYK